MKNYEIGFAVNVRANRFCLPMDLQHETVKYHHSYEGKFTIKTAKTCHLYLAILVQLICSDVKCTTPVRIAHAVNMCDLHPKINAIENMMTRTKSVAKYE